MQTLDALPQRMDCRLTQQLLTVQVMSQPLTDLQLPRHLLTQESLVTAVSRLVVDWQLTQQLLLWSENL